MDPEISSKILPAILGIVQLRRIMSDVVHVNEVAVRIGAEIPSYQITTVELAMTASQKKAYRALHEEISDELIRDRSQDTEKNKIQ